MSNAALAAADPSLRAPADFYKGGGGIDPTGIAVSAAANLLPEGDARLAAQSVTFTGEPISTAILSVGRFILGKSSQNKAEKSARLAQSTARDMGVTGIVGQFIADIFDPNDPRTIDLLKEAEADLAITNPKDPNRGDRQHAISEKAWRVLADQIEAGRVSWLPDSSEFPTSVGTGEESSEAIGSRISYAIVAAALGTVAKKKTGKTPDDLYREKYGITPGDAQNQSFVQLLKDAIGWQDRPTATRESIQNSGSLGGGQTQTNFTMATGGGTDRIIPQTRVVQVGQDNKILIVLGVAALGLLAFSIVRARS